MLRMKTSDVPGNVMKTVTQGKCEGSREKFLIIFKKNALKAPAPTVAQKELSI